MSFLLVVRRLHLYLGLVLLPWVVLFGVSSYPFSHPVSEQPAWTVIGDRQYSVDAAAGTDARTVGERMHRDAGFRGGFYANRPSPRQVTVYHPDFFHPVRINYFADQGRLLIERREFYWRQVLTSMHAHAGYELGGFWNIVWAVVIDALCVALVLWIASGLVMWWLLPGSRNWGWVAIAGGLATFAILVFRL